MNKKLENYAIWLQKNSAKIHGFIAPHISADNCTYFSDGVHCLKIHEKISGVNVYDNILSGVFDRHYHGVVNHPAAFCTVSAPTYKEVRSALSAAKRDRENQGFRRNATRYIWRIADGCYVNAEYLVRVLQALNPETIQCGGKGIFYCNNAEIGAKCIFCGIAHYGTGSFFDNDFLLN